MSDACWFVILEAMCYELPVLSSREIVIPDIVEEGKTGFLVQKNDHQALAEKIKQLLHDEELRIMLMENSRKRFLEKYTRYIF